MMKPEKITAARQLYDSKEDTLASIARTLGVRRPTLYLYICQADQPMGSALMSPSNPQRPPPPRPRPAPPPAPPPKPRPAEKRGGKKPGTESTGPMTKRP